MYAPCRPGRRNTPQCHGLPSGQNYVGMVSLSGVNRIEWQSAFCSARKAGTAEHCFRCLTRLCITFWMPSKPQRHPDMAALESEPLIEPLRIGAGLVREQFDQLAAIGARFS